MYLARSFPLINLQAFILQQSLLIDVAEGQTRQMAHLRWFYAESGCTWQCHGAVKAAKSEQGRDPEDTGEDSGQKFPNNGLCRAKPTLFKTIQLKTSGGNFIASTYRLFSVRKPVCLRLYIFKIWYRDRPVTLGGDAR